MEYLDESTYDGWCILYLRYSLHGLSFFKDKLDCIMARALSYREGRYLLSQITTIKSELYYIFCMLSHETMVRSDLTKFMFV